jgi:hypothetical protein
MATSSGLWVSISSIVRSKNEFHNDYRIWILQFIELQNSILLITRIKPNPIIVVPGQFLI